MAGCRRQHGSSCWLIQPLVDAFRSIKEAGKVDAIVVDDDAPSSNPRVAPVRLYSVEVWNVSTGALAGGELGYTVGSIYTSLTGFSDENSAGSVQLAALGRLLGRLGFSVWDLGMSMTYKTSLGSHLMERHAYVSHVRSVRETKRNLVLPTDAEALNAKAMIDGETDYGPQGQQKCYPKSDANISESKNKAAHEPPFEDGSSTVEKKKQRSSDSHSHKHQSVRR